MAPIPLVRDTTPKLMPLNAPTIPGGGALRQSTTPFQLKPLQDSDFIINAKVHETDDQSRLTAQAQKLVAQAFYGPILKQMHDSPFKAPWVDGGRGGQAFEPLLDQRLVDHLSKTSGKKLVKSLVRKIERHKGSKGREAHELNNAKIKSTGHHVAPGLRA